MSRIKVNAIVVLYNSKIEESQTIKSIFNADLSNVDLTLSVWNNGKSLLDKDDIAQYIGYCTQKGIASEIYQDIRNISLSKVYNYFIYKSDYDFISILDQDTNVNEDFFKNIGANSSYDVICPEVYLINRGNVKSSPIYGKSKDDNDLDFVESGDFNANKFLTCASGLSLSRQLMCHVKEHYGTVFDEKYAFYWADINFLERLAVFDFIKGKCIGKLYHDISGIGDNYHEMKESSKLEHGYGKIIIRINQRNKAGIIRNVIYAIKYSLKAKCSLNSMLKIVLCALLRKHPRSVFNINKKIKPTHSYHP